MVWLVENLPPWGEAMTFVRSPGFLSLPDLMEWFADQGAVEVRGERGPDRTWRGSAVLRDKTKNQGDDDGSRGENG